MPLTKDRIANINLLLNQRKEADAERLARISSNLKNRIEADARAADAKTIAAAEAGYTEEEAAHSAIQAKASRLASEQATKLHQQIMSQTQICSPQSVPLCMDVTNPDEAYVTSRLLDSIRPQTLPCGCALVWIGL